MVVSSCSFLNTHLVTAQEAVSQVVVVAYDDDGFRGRHWGGCMRGLGDLRVNVYAGHFFSVRAKQQELVVGLSR